MRAAGSAAFGAGVICPFAGSGSTVRLGATMWVLVVAFVLLTLVVLVLLDHVKVEPFAGWDSHSDL